MNTRNPNLPLLESVAHALGVLRNRLVFVGGCASGLLLTDSAAPAARVTQDVDAIVDVTSLAEYHRLELQLQQAGFKHDRSPDAPICRWIGGGGVLDVMPTDERVLGFGNRWYAEAVLRAGEFRLPNGLQIRLISSPLFLATKLEAFSGRGGSDFRASHDLEDIVALLDGRPELVAEVSTASGELRSYLSSQVRGY